MLLQPALDPGVAPAGFPCFEIQPTNIPGLTAWLAGE